MTIRTVWLLGGVIWLMASSAILVHAQETGQRFTLSVSPATGYVTAKPGATTIHTVVLRNKSTQSITVTPRLVDFSSDGSSGTPVLAKATSFTYLANQNEVFAPVTIAPAQQASIPFAIRPPEDAPLHEFHVTILFEQQPSALTSDSSTLVPTIGSNLVVLVTGTEASAQLKVISLQRSKLLDSFRPLTFRPLAENQGQAAGIASGSAEIKDWRGRTVATFPIYPDVILAGTTRGLRAAEPAVPVLPDDPKALIATQLKPTDFSYRQPILLGTYTVVFNLITPGKEGETISTQQFTVIVLPFSAIAMILITTAAIVIIRHRRKRNIQLHPETEEAL